MISETLAGTNAGASEVSLSDTSSSKPHPLGGATAESAGEIPTNGISAAPASSAQGLPRQGWWKRAAAEAVRSATPLVQIGEVPEPARTTSPAVGGEGDSEFRENNSQQVVESADSATSPALPPNGFEGLGLAPDVLKAVAQSGYTIPTPIQAQGIPVVLQHRDIIGIAQTGTGKTASFTLPMIELLARGRPKARMPRSLILEPTRELAAQVAESFEKYGKYNKLSMALLIGGTSFDDQERKLDRGVDVLIATPGRLLDHFERGKLMLSQVQILVVDEADRMLDMGFIPDVERICKLIPFTRQTLFYSATMPAEIRRLTEQFLHNPVKVEVARPATTAENITQEAIDVPANDWAKREALRRVIRDNEVGNAIVFCNRKRDVDIVAKSLSKHGFNAAPLHGDLDQSVRTRTLDAFRAGTVQILVASDVAARGLDIPSVSHIFNFDVPYHADDYVHRIGRTGRAGRSGHAVMLVTPRDAKYLEAIQKLTGNRFESRTLEGLADAVRERPARSDHKHAERGDRNRGGRSRDRRPRPVADHGHRAAIEPTQPQTTVSESVAAPVAHKPEPVRHGAQSDHTRGPARTSRHEPRAKVAAHVQQKPRPSQVPDAQQLPAFLLRPIKVPKAEKPAPRARQMVTAED